MKFKDQHINKQGNVDEIKIEGITKQERQRKEEIIHVRNEERRLARRNPERKKELTEK